MIGKRSRRSLRQMSQQPRNHLQGSTMGWKIADPGLNLWSNSSKGEGNRRLSQSSSSGFSVLVWDLTSPEGRVMALTAHTAAVTSTAFSPNGLQLASGSNDGTVRIWSVPALRQVGLCRT